jgi:competence protein ComEC
MRNKRFSIVAIILLLVFVLSGSALASPTVYLDGKQLTFEVQPVIEDSRTLVPLRAIFEAMGATVSWNSNAQTATAQKGTTSVILPIGSLNPTINGQTRQLDVPGKIVNGRTLAPLRFVGEAFGGNVRWEAATETIYITSLEKKLQLSSTQKVFVHFIDVGQADSIYIKLPNNNDILIDAGNIADGPLVVDYLKDQGVDDIELLIATHPHEDHIGGLPAVLNGFQVEKVIDSGKSATSKIYSTYEAAVKAEGCAYEQDNYQSYTWGNTALQIYTGGETWNNLNDYSVVCRLDTGDIEFLFTGDSEAPVEAALKGDISAEILKVGHHGSTSSTSPGFLNKVNPEVAVISVGAGNTYGHPAPETISKLQGVKVYRTDLNGNIVVSTDGKAYSVTAQKNATAEATLNPKPEGTPPPLPVASQGAYIGSIISDKYHLPICRYAKAIDWANEIWFQTKEEAIAAGYKPCGVCKP